MTAQVLFHHVRCCVLSTPPPLLQCQYISISILLWLISIAGLGFGFRLRHGFLYYAGISISSGSDSDPLIEMYVIGTEICP